MRKAKWVKSIHLCQFIFVKISCVKIISWYLFHVKLLLKVFQVCCCSSTFRFLLFQARIGARGRWTARCLGDISSCSNEPAPTLNFIQMNLRPTLNFTFLFTSTKERQCAWSWSWCCENMRFLPFKLTDCSTIWIWLHLIADSWRQTTSETFNNKTERDLSSQL